MIKFGFERGKKYRVIREIKLHTKPIVMGYLTFDGVYEKETRSYYVFDNQRIRKDKLYFFTELCEEELSPDSENDEDVLEEETEDTVKEGAKNKSYYCTPEKVCDTMMITPECLRAMCSEENADSMPFDMSSMGKIISMSIPDAADWLERKSKALRKLYE